MNNIFIRTGKLLVTAAALTLFECGNPAKTTTPKADSAAMEVKPAAQATGTLIGAWHDAAIHSDKGEQIAYELVTSGDKTYIQAITFVGTKLKLNDIPPVSPSASELKKDGDKYTSLERPGERYEIAQDGDLLIYDGTELIAKCKKLI